LRIYSPTEAYFNGSWTPPQFVPAKWVESLIAFSFLIVSKYYL
jgi:hypothetical protein